VRLLLVAIEVEEGRSIGEVARSWGVSRQLASRWVQESAGLRD
jgi:transposase-like protein